MFGGAECGSIHFSIPCDTEIGRSKCEPVLALLCKQAVRIIERRGDCECGPHANWQLSRQFVIVIGDRIGWHRRQRCRREGRHRGRQSERGVHGKCVLGRIRSGASAPGSGVRGITRVHSVHDGAQGVRVGIKGSHSGRSDADVGTSSAYNAMFICSCFIVFG